MLVAIEQVERPRREVLETTVNDLTFEAIQALSREYVLVIHIKQFVSEDLCNVLSERAEGIGYKGYLNVPSVRRIGMAFYETEGKREVIDRYFETAQQNIQDFRDACAPYCSPIDVSGSGERSVRRWRAPA